MSPSAELQTPEDAARLAKAETMLTPRFYKTDYAAMDRLDMSPIRAEWDAMMAEYEGDNNHDHFLRTPEFAADVAALSATWSPQLRRDFQDFLVSSLTSEYSGCVLYNEIARNVSNPDIRQLMRYLTRDESRHANFINQSLKDFGLQVDWSVSSAPRPTPTSNRSTSSTPPICRKRSATRATSASTGSWSSIRRSGFIRSSNGSSAGAMTSSATASPSP